MLQHWFVNSKYLLYSCPITIHNSLMTKKRDKKLFMCKSSLLFFMYISGELFSKTKLAKLPGQTNPQASGKRTRTSVVLISMKKEPR
jgi:hypothetical protein